MEILDASTLAIIFAMGFVAAFIDSVVGGGGLISIPTLMWAGLPMVNVLGTNKLAACMGAVVGAATFFRSGNADKKFLRILFPMAFIGSILGVLIVRDIPPDFLRPLVVVMLIVIAIYSLLKKDLGKREVNIVPQRKFSIGVVLIFIMGIYDGFFGPGTGSFMLFLFLMLGYGFLGAAANARICNFASNLSGVMTFFYFGLINLSYALPMGFGMMIGAYCGAKMALAKGADYVRPLFIIVTTVLIGKQLLELFK